MTDFTQTWITRLQRVTASTVVTIPFDSRDDDPHLSLDSGVLSIRGAAKTRGGCFILFGNGGLLATAMHIATDYSLAGGRSIALADPVAITSHTNDFHSELNFTKQIELLARIPPTLLLPCLVAASRRTFSTRCAPPAPPASMSSRSPASTPTTHCADLAISTSMCRHTSSGLCNSRTSRCERTWNFSADPQSVHRANCRRRCLPDNKGACFWEPCVAANGVPYQDSPA